MNFIGATAGRPELILDGMSESRRKGENYEFRHDSTVGWTAKCASEKVKEAEVLLPGKF